jgi:hypothetical protein
MGLVPQSGQAADGAARGCWQVATKLWSFLDATAGRLLSPARSSRC